MSGCLPADGRVVSLAAGFVVAKGSCESSDGTTITFWSAPYFLTLVGHGMGLSVGRERLVSHGIHPPRDAKDPSGWFALTLCTGLAVLADAATQRRIPPGNESNTPPQPAYFVEDELRASHLCQKYGQRPRMFDKIGAFEIRSLVKVDLTQACMVLVYIPEQGLARCLVLTLMKVMCHRR